MSQQHTELNPKTITPESVIGALSDDLGAKVAYDVINGIDNDFGTTLLRTRLLTVVGLPADFDLLQSEDPVVENPAVVTFRGALLGYYGVALAGNPWIVDAPHAVPDKLWQAQRGEPMTDRYASSHLVAVATEGRIAIGDLHQQVRTWGGHASPGLTDTGRFCTGVGLAFELSRQAVDEAVAVVHTRAAEIFDDIFTPEESSNMGRLLQ